MNAERNTHRWRILSAGWRLELTAMRFYRLTRQEFASVAVLHKLSPSLLAEPNRLA